MVCIKIKVTKHKPMHYFTNKKYAAIQAKDNYYANHFLFTYISVSLHRHSVNYSHTENCHKPIYKNTINSSEHIK